MYKKSTDKISVVIPNWNGKDTLGECLDSLLKQSLKPTIIVVENGSTDGSLEFIQKNYPDVELVINKKNLGFAGGVNSGIRESIRRGFDYVALFNNDAVADQGWLAGIAATLDSSSDSGIATCKFMSIDKKHIDSTGDLYTVWGLPYPRGRGEPVDTSHEKASFVFCASGGASIYRVAMLKDIGLFDEDFFAYYEDVDLSFRAQLAGWKVKYVPEAIAYHHIGATSGKIKGFTTYQTMKNLPWVYWKNVPARYLFRVGWRLKLAYVAFFFSAVRRGQGWSALKGSTVSVLLAPKKLIQRWKIQGDNKVQPQYIWGLMTHDLPPNAYKLRAMRARWWRITAKDKA
jgi:GT2 family glycosyltransferase